ncbi:MAG: cell envelope-related transcriptional attenuator [Conexibacter sp.]|jgi:LCP family protein required for cell wall assembly|nr:cell envelope-related transcriptional attenuator [Conexibacter sp.]
MPPEFPGRARRGTWVRYVCAALLVIGLTAGATATAGLLQVKGFVDDLKAGTEIGGLGGVVATADLGKPQTLLLLGSDHRFATGANARSDTIMLMRLDPSANAITVLSIPRDLEVSYVKPDGTRVKNAKINQAYTDGGEKLTAKVIKRLLGPIEINHIVNINFGGFQRVVDAIGCVYVDVDHRYYHSNAGLPPSQQYAEIDIQPGYQRLCGRQALDYVRYRHGDSDFVRAARQQDFLRAMKSQYGIDAFVSDPHRLTAPLGKSLSTDPGLRSTDGLLKLARLAGGIAGKPVRQIQFQANDATVNGGAYLVASPQQIAQARHDFLKPPPQPPRAPKPPRASRGRGRAQGAAPAAASLHLADMTQTGRDYAIQLGGGVGIPIYYPKLLLSGSQYATRSAGTYPRAYRIKAPDGTMRAAYRLVVSTGEAGNYYGVEGTSWTDPPILKGPSSDHRTVGGKRLDLYYDGTKLRTVGWRDGSAAYWVENTLQDRLTNPQMLAIAGSLTRLGG